MAKGGARPGAGRPAGSVTRPQLRDYFGEEDLEVLVTDLMLAAQEDNQILKFIAEQLFGKAPQPLTGDGGGPIQLSGVEISVRKKTR
jgi:hypothetical protein